MSETVTFANFDIRTDRIEDIGAVNGGPGAQADLHMAFDVKAGDDPIKTIAPNSALQKNVPLGVRVLSDPGVQVRLGYEEPVSPFVVARDLNERAGLQEAVVRPVMRPFMADENIPGEVDAAVLKDHVERWVSRASGLLVGQATQGVEFGKVIAVASGRKVGEGESDIYPVGTTSNRMLLDKINKLADMRHEGTEVVQGADTEADSDSEDPKYLFGNLELITVLGGGSEGLRKLAGHLAIEVDLSEATILMPAVSGNWLLGGLQLRRALRGVMPLFDCDPTKPQLYVVSDYLQQGRTGNESKVTHQNPIAALGNTVRSFDQIDKTQRQA